MIDLCAGGGGWACAKDKCALWHAQKRCVFSVGLEALPLLEEVIGNLELLQEEKKNGRDADV